ncbi:MAG: nicotinate (nicotinamide) nucleotide adenylyltransferase [Spirochaetia bacterium]|nr:nicotinate (nicotinamide) nucleotide adenylyltransferase [Spirochaetia bacterium]
MQVKKTAILGGTFNPVHKGHIYLSQLIIRNTDYSRLLFIPVNKPSHKIEKMAISAEHRISMLKMAIQEIASVNDNTELVLDDCEINRGGLSFSLDTVNYVYNTYSIEGKLGFIIGDDLVAGLENWYNWDILKGKVTFLIAKREFSLLEDHWLPDGISYKYLENAVKEISSSTLRMKIMKGEDVSEFLPVSVYEYIKENRLYNS